MTVRDARDILGARVLVGEEYLDREVRSACGSDMMSDVLAFSKDHSILLTGLCNPQAVSYTHLSFSRPISNFFAVQGITLTLTMSLGSMPIFSA